MRRRLSAFSLIEIAMSLIVLGLIAGISIPLMLANYHLNQQRVTENHKEQIFSSLAAYVLNHHQLPAPAKTPEGIAGEPCPAAGESCVGFVPYTTLGLSEKTAKDGYGNWFTFAVHNSLTRTSASTDNRSMKFCAALPNRITVRNIHTNKKVVNFLRDPIAFVLVSHGRAGRGALINSNTRTPSSDFEATNSKEDLEFVEGIAPNFDHHVYWTTRDNFISFYTKIPCSNNFWEAPPPPQQPLPSQPPPPGDGEAPCETPKVRFLDDNFD